MKHTPNHPQLVNKSCRQPVAGQIGQRLSGLGSHVGTTQGEKGGRGKSPWGSMDREHLTVRTGLTKQEQRKLNGCKYLWGFCQGSR